MAIPRVFISSTYYDLKYVRSSLELFIDSLGYDSVLSEKGEVTYSPDVPLDESCYREVQNSDIYVLIIGGRYGSATSDAKASAPRTFYELYESVTKLEYKAALEMDIPTYVMIERSVYAEYQTYKRNRENESIQYAHVDSINVFRFIEEILSQPQNNPYHQFDKYSDIEAWLRLQWAGLFRDLLQRRSSQKQLASLSAQVTDLAEVNKTLRHYLETVMQEVSPQQSAAIIKAERERLDERDAVNRLRNNGLLSFLHIVHDIPVEHTASALSTTNTFGDFLRKLAKIPNINSDRRQSLYNELLDLFLSYIDDGGRQYGPFMEVSSARQILNLPPYPPVTRDELALMSSSPGKNSSAPSEKTSKSQSSRSTKPKNPSTNGS